MVDSELNLDSILQQNSSDDKETYEFPGIDSFSFACGGWLQLYMFGVGRAIQARGLDKNVKLAGSSAGALCAVGLALHGNFDSAVKFVKEECVPQAYESISGLFKIKDFVAKCLDVHSNLHLWKELIPGQLQIAVTKLPFLTKERVTSFHSQEDLKQSLLASSAAFPLAPLVYRRGGWFVDGGITDFQPIIDKNTITVSPLYFSNAHIKPSRYVPLWWAIVPPRNSDTIDWIYRLGWDDACHWIDTNCDKKYHEKEGTPEPPPRSKHPYDIPRRISLHRLIGYNPTDMMNKYVAYTLDLLLTILLIFLWRPLALLLIYCELLLHLGSHLCITVYHELYAMSPMIALGGALIGPQYLLMLITTSLMYAYKMIMIGPSQSHSVRQMWECITCIGSWSLLTRFFSITPSAILLRKHHKLCKLSLLYRIVRHFL